MNLGQARTNDFRKDLAFSHDSKLDNEVEEIIRNSLKVDKIIDISNTQLGIESGIDKLCLHNGSSLTVEVKIRRDEWTDILLETSSVEEDDRAGWLFTSLADYLLYGFKCSNRIKYVLFELIKLRSWWNQNKHRGWKLIHARNKGYTTISAVVPLKDLQSVVLKETVSQYMLSDFVGGGL